MIRFAQRRLIIPQGDTGAFSLPAQGYTPNVEMVAVFSIFNLEKRIFQKEIHVDSDMISIDFTHEETKDLPVGLYNWDIKMYINPSYKEGLLIDGDEVNSYYAGFELPECEIALAPIHGRG